jgi:hypothetical protein
MPGKRDVFQEKYIGKDYLAWGSDLILDKEIAWKKISRRARRSILKAKKIDNLKILKMKGTKEELDLFRSIWYDPNDPDLGNDGFKKNQHVFFAYLNKEFIAGTIVTEVGPNLFLHFNGATEEAKEMQIPSLMIWNIVEQFHRSKFKYLDIGCSFRESLQEFFKNWSTYEYPIIFHAPDLKPTINITPFNLNSMSIVSDKKINVDEELDKIFNDNPFTYFPRGKYAIYSILKYLNLNKEDEVYITTTTGSPYLSIGVSTTVEAVCGWSRKISDKTKAIILIHEFGFIHPKSEEIKNICIERKIPLIEDCAYAWTSGKSGSYGDYVIYSLPKYFPVQYGGILVGKKFDDKEVWNNFYCLDVKKRVIIKEQLSNYISKTKEIAEKRTKNYLYLEKIFNNEGFKSFFKLKEGEVPAVYMLKVENFEKMKEISDRLKYFGIECGSYYHNNAVFLPIHQNLEVPHLNYIFGAVRSLYRENCGVYSPEYFGKITETKMTDRNDMAEEFWENDNKI